MDSIIRLAELEDESHPFDADAFVSSSRKLVTLGALKAGLEAAEAEVDGELFSLINEDYAAFLSLSTDLSGLSSALDGLSTPLSSARSHVASVSSHLSAAADDFAAKLKHRQQLAATRAELSLCLDAGRSLDKLEALLGLSPGGSSSGTGSGSGSGSGSGTRSGKGSGKGKGGGGGRGTKRKGAGSGSNSHVIERVGGELNRLLHLVEGKSHLAYVASLGGRIKAVQAGLRDSLRESFLDALAAGDRHGIKLALRTYVAVQGVTDAEAVVASGIITPGLDPVVTKATLEKGVLGSHQGLPDIYAALLRLVRRPQLRSLLELGSEARGSASSAGTGRREGDEEGTGKGLGVFEFMGNSVLGVLVSLIDERIPGIFAPGLPDLFHANYSATMEFLDNLEACLPSRPAVLAFRASDAYSAFMRKWNLPVYFQLRFQAVAGPFQAAFATPLALASLPDDVVAEGGEKNVDLVGALEQTRALEAGLNMVWSPSFVLRPISGSLLKLSLQMLARYISWIDLVLDRGTVAEGDASPVSLYEYAVIDSDVRVVLQSVLPRTRAAVLGVVGGVESVSESSSSSSSPSTGTPDVEALIDSALSVPSSSLSRLYSCVDDAVVRGIVDAGSSAIGEELSALPRSFRGMSRPVPDTASGYVLRAFEPLEGFEEEVEGLSPLDRVATWREACCVGLVSVLVQQMDDVVSSVKNAADSLRRLRRPTKTDGNDYSDTYKIYLQLELDLDALVDRSSLSPPVIAPLITPLSQRLSQLKTEELDQQ